ncbi:MAG: DUF779 domain-containing protein [Hyphomicrobium sp.]|uniref:DUF779 domain-containing protein n=1 Tax=Hyphomicrobium sp. TaxID=82 RepID=UPI003D0FB9C0
MATMVTATTLTSTVVTATRAARDLLGALTAEHGALSLHVSGRYGVSVICLERGELAIGPRDVLIGHLGDVPLYMMTSEIKYWEGSPLIVDVLRGIGHGFSLEGPRGVHFILTKRVAAERPVWDADAVLAAGPPPSMQSGSHTDD